MIELKDKNGTTVVGISEDLFPLSLPLQTSTGLKDYKINLNYVRDREGHKTTRLKNINVTIDRD